MRWVPSDDPSVAPVGDIVEGTSPCPNCGATGQTIHRPFPGSLHRQYKSCPECGGRGRLRTWWLVLPDGPKLLTVTPLT